MKYGILKIWMMMFTSMMCYIDDGAGAGGDGGDALLAGKYKTQGELVTGYTELQTAFSGKDEAHKAILDGFKSPETFNAGEGWNSDNPMNNRMMSVFQDVAKENNMSQAMYESLVNGMTEMTERVQETELQDVQKSIANFDNRVNAIADTALKYLRPDEVKAMDAFFTSKDSFEAIEKLMSHVRGSGLPPTIAPVTRTNADLRADIRNLNPADTTKRKELMEELNARGDGEGRLT